MPRIHPYQQLEATDCGITCIRILAKYYGKDIPLQTLRDVCDTNRLGISIKNLVAGMTDLGMLAKCIKIDLDELREITLNLTDFVCDWSRDTEKGIAIVAAPRDEFYDKKYYAEKRQKQRLMIARAIYRNPEILILDEATSSLDANNEARILDNIKRLWKGRTTIIIAHRLSTIKDSDQILFMKDGHIVESGTHTALLLAKGGYHSLVQKQMPTEELTQR